MKSKATRSNSSEITALRTQLVTFRKQLLLGLKGAPFRKDPPCAQ